mmetsp:Transcript_57466/g.102655  ORF Transcript_57466/g.102655 Transcript_57466/m.102655 type:complete len:82 (-) Transcript_57466:30-275(-)
MLHFGLEPPWTGRPQVTTHQPLLSYEVPIAALGTPCKAPACFAFVASVAQCFVWAFFITAGYLQPACPPDPPAWRVPWDHP